MSLARTRPLPRHPPLHRPRLLAQKGPFGRQSRQRLRPPARPPKTSTSPCTPASAKRASATPTSCSSPTPCPTASAPASPARPTWPRPTPGPATPSPKSASKTPILKTGASLASAGSRSTPGSAWPPPTPNPSGLKPLPGPPPPKALSPAKPSTSTSSPPPTLKNIKANSPARSSSSVPSAPPPTSPSPSSTRYTAEELKEMEGPQTPRRTWRSRADSRRLSPVFMADRQRLTALRTEALKLFTDEGVAAIITPSRDARQRRRDRHHLRR